MRARAWQVASFTVLLRTAEGAAISDGSQQVFLPKKALLTLVRLPSAGLTGFVFGLSRKEAWAVESRSAFSE